MPHPTHPHHLAGSKWTAATGECGARHWRVREWRKREGCVELEAVLTGARVRLPWRELRDRARWLPGWVSVTSDH